MQTQQDHTFKIILIGSSYVGKSQILERFTKNSFNEHYKNTAGIEFGSKILKIKDMVVKLQIWDTVGQEKFRALTKGYYKGAAGVLLVYDITDEKSFQDLDIWYKQICQLFLTLGQFLQSSGAIILLIANKLDLQKQRTVSKSKGLEFSHSKKLPLFQVSAKSGLNIDKIFSFLTQQILNSLNNTSPNQQKQTKQENVIQQVMSKSQIKLNNSAMSVLDKTSSSSCC